MPRDGEYIHAQWEQALQRRGVNSVRLLMRISAGPDADSIFRSLMAEPPFPPRAFVESWLARSDGSAGKLGRKLLWPILLVMVAAGVMWCAVTFGDVQILPLLARVG